MARRARKYVRGPFYHIMCQGIKKEDVFLEKEDFEKYLYLMNKYKVEYGIEIISYCIMSNHVHLLLYSNDIKQISKYMHQINLIYAMNYNMSYERVGYVFRDRFKLEEITDINYLYYCILYIHNNPVKAGICKSPKEYKYSSYNEYLNGVEIVNLDILNLILGVKNCELIIRDEREEYECFIDVENNAELKAKQLIENFIKIRETNLSNILTNTKVRKELLIELHVKNKISYRCLEKVLNIDRKKLSDYVYGKK